MENLFTENFLKGVAQFFANCDWIFMVIFVCWAYVMNKVSESEDKYKWLNWFSKIPKGLRVFLMGVLLAPIYAILSGNMDKDGVSAIFYTITVGMVFYEIAIKKLFEYIENKSKK